MQLNLNSYQQRARTIQRLSRVGTCNVPLKQYAHFVAILCGGDDCQVISCIWSATT